MNIAMILEMAAGALSDRVAVSASGVRLTYDELLQRSLAAAEIFSRDDRQYVGLLDVNSAAIPVALFGAAFANLPYAPLNYRLAPADLNGLLARIAPATLVTTDEKVLGLSYPETVGTLAPQHLLGTLPAGLSPPMPDEADGRIAVQLFTSGTTGQPKAAILRHENLMSYILGTVEFASAAEDDAVLVTVPPYHIAGISAVLSSVYAGRRMVLLDSFDAHAWLKTCAAEKITNAFVVPTMMVRIVDELNDQPNRWDLSSLRAIAFGGGKMPLAVITRAMALLPHVDFTNAYGLTETSSTICLLTPEDHRIAVASEDASVRGRLASVGRPIDAIEIQVRDDYDMVVQSGMSGHVYVRGGQVAGEYLGLGSTLDAEGWFPTRDRGYLDGEGFLFLEGRADDVIVRGGENISPGEVEDVLLTHPDILDAAVVAVPDDYWGEAIGAVVVARPGAEVSVHELQLLVKDRLRSSRVPSVIQFRSELPYSEMGKVLRRVIRDELEQSQPSANG
jgi:long-chain acyl-CoA synthetase